MAGHSHWKSIKHKKGAADARRGKTFSKLAKYITVAARQGGGNPADNLRLRYAIDKARAESMPKDSIERAIKKGTGELQGSELAELVYEAIGPGGCSIVVEVLTDNRNRTAGEVRAIVEKRGGSMGRALWKFQRQGVVEVSKDDVSEEEVFEAAIDAGADDVKSTESSVVVTTDVEHFEAVRSALRAIVEKKRQKPEKKWGEAEDDRPLFLRSELTYVPLATVRVEGDKAKQLLSLVEELEEHDDVQNVYADFDIPEESFA
ncbi:MAG: YebC/PmpR family DNA-binding transcriptional regulator [Planctomycetota bacterium]